MQASEGIDFLVGDEVAVIEHANIQTDAFAQQLPKFFIEESRDVQPAVASSRSALLPP